MKPFQQLLLGARRAGIGERLAGGTAAAVVLVAAVVVLVPGESRSSRQGGVAEGIAEGQTTGSTDQGSTDQGSTAQEGVDGRTGTRRTNGSAEVGSASPGSAPEHGGSKGTAAAQRVTATSIKVGVHIPDPGGARAVQAAFGDSGSTLGNDRDAAQAVIKYLNAHGGIAGRKVIPVYDEFDATDPSYSAQYQKACATFTQDNRVLAVASNVGGSTAGYEVLAACLAKAKTTYVVSSLDATDQVDFDRFAPYMYAPAYLGAHRWGTVIDQLVAGGYFDKGARLGVMWMNKEANRRSRNGPIQRRLAAHGLKVTADATLSPVAGSADYGTVSRETSQAVLRFRQAGVTHVLYLASFGWGPFFFMSAAESQGYRPRHAMTSFENIQGQIGNAPRAQLERSLAVSWWPTKDVAFPQDPKDNPVQAQCEKIIRDAGVEVPSRFGFSAFVAICDALFFLKATFERAEALTPAGFRSAVDRFGTTYRSPMTYSTRFGPGRFDGVNATRVIAFDDGCGCYKYKGKWQPSP